MSFLVDTGSARTTIFRDAVAYKEYMQQILNDSGSGSVHLLKDSPEKFPCMMLDIGYVQRRRGRLFVNFFVYSWLENGQ